MQKVLSKDQIELFYDYWGDESQVKHFLQLVPRDLLGQQNVIVDVGGSVGFFADSVRKCIGAKVRVLDTDPIAIKTCLDKGLDASLEDALHPKHRGDEDVVCLNLILHHMIGSDERATLLMQQQALKTWADHARFIFVNELSYESYFANLSGKLIYFITSSKLLSAIASAVSRFVPSLRANTFGVGVRFRGGVEWVKLFEQSGFRVVASVQGVEKSVSLPQRILLIKKISQDSWLIESSLRA